MIQIIRTVWKEDYVPISTPHYQLPPVKIAPKPAHPIPLWIAGTSERAYRRAVELGDGYHGHAVQDITVENVVDRVERIRRHRPEESFTFSLYTWEWDLTRRRRGRDRGRTARPSRPPVSSTSSSRWILRISKPG